MLKSKSIQNVPGIYLHYQPIEHVKKYNNLGTVINENNDRSEEIGRSKWLKPYS